MDGWGAAAAAAVAPESPGLQSDLDVPSQFQADTGGDRHPSPQKPCCFYRLEGTAL